MGDQGETPYAWLALWAALRFRDNNDGPEGHQMARVVGLAGQLRRPANNATNGLFARLIILVAFWWLACANYRANITGPRPVLRKLPGAPIFHPVPRHPALDLLIPVSALILSLCQNDHPPT